MDDILYKIKQLKFETSKLIEGKRPYGEVGNNKTTSSKKIKVYENQFEYFMYSIIIIDGFEKLFLEEYFKNKKIDEEFINEVNNLIIKMNNIKSDFEISNFEKEIYNNHTLISTEDNKMFEIEVFDEKPEQIIEDKTIFNQKYYENVLKHIELFKFDKKEIKEIKEIEKEEDKKESNKVNVYFRFQDDYIFILNKFKMKLP